MRKTYIVYEQSVLSLVEIINAKFRRNQDYSTIAKVPFPVGNRKTWRDKHQRNLLDLVTVSEFLSLAYRTLTYLLSSFEHQPINQSSFPPSSGPLQVSRSSDHLICSVINQASCRRSNHYEKIAIFLSSLYQRRSAIPYRRTSD